jgi:hypothetical protein
LEVRVSVITICTIACAILTENGRNCRRGPQFDSDLRRVAPRGG